MSNLDSSGDLHQLAAHCRSYQGADAKRSTVQLAVTAALFATFMSGMIVCYHFALGWLIPVLLLPTSGLLIRLFIIQHDCGHGSFFKSRTLNDLAGRAISVLTITPYDPWRRAHNIHHSASGNLDHRGAGGIDTLTVREYRAMPRSKRIGYRLYRNPVILLLIATPVHFIFIQRFPFRTMAPFFESFRAVPTARVWRSVLLLDLAVALLYGGMAAIFGWRVLFAVNLPVLVMTSWIGGWLFFVQHQFEDTYWQRHDQWEFKEAALSSSSHYVLPKVVQWFTGNIGLHHVHHLCSAIPNYRLQECVDKNATLKDMNRLTFLESLKCLSFSLWDEDKQRMVGFRALKAR